MSDAVIGEIRLMATSKVPFGWLECDGKELEAHQYPELYALIGCTYGGVWGKTFKLPDLRGRLAVGAKAERDADGFALGARFGAKEMALTVSQLPAHGHGFNVTNQPATSPEPGKMSGFGNPPSTQSFYIDTTQPTNGSISFSGQSIGETLSDGKREVPHDNVMPCVALRFIICTGGLFPSFA